MKKKKKKKLLVHSSVWGIYYEFTHKAQTVRFKQLDKVRDFAKKNGYSGIHIEFI